MQRKNGCYRQAFAFYLLQPLSGHQTAYPSFLGSFRVPECAPNEIQRVQRKGGLHRQAFTSYLLQSENDRT